MSMEDEVEQEVLVPRSNQLAAERKNANEQRKAQLKKMADRKRIKINSTSFSSEIKTSIERVVPYRRGSGIYRAWLILSGFPATTNTQPPPRQYASASGCSEKCDLRTGVPYRQHTHTEELILLPSLKPFVAYHAFTEVLFDCLI